jgi:hypothetical protein
LVYILSPSIKKEKWTSEEDSLLEELVLKHGKNGDNLLNTSHEELDIMVRNRYSLLMKHTKKGKKENIELMKESIMDYKNKLYESVEIGKKNFNDCFEDPLVNSFPIEGPLDWIFPFDYPKII